MEGPFKGANVVGKVGLEQFLEANDLRLLLVWGDFGRVEHIDVLDATHHHACQNQQPSRCTNDDDPSLPTMSYLRHCMRPTALPISS